ncbi:post-GPI attachment to proteins factor 4-like isoform X2 [Patiria miniata]|uniref:Uncharacterized protein n=1 Tax=Patiria miniata TaxID=46514 RepID=A0A913Z791_PATMI|nr:post-GPI attachment to proteins factor 4-like isoform X2 [Patiria miniata]
MDMWKGAFVKTATVYGVTFLLVLPLLCHNLPYSVYFIAPHDIEQRPVRLNQHRVEEAEQYLSKLETNGPLKALPTSSNLQIAIGVVSVSRKVKTVNTKYLTQVMVGLHDIITRAGVADKVFAFICNTQKATQTHPEADDLASYFHVARFPPNRTRHNAWRHEEEKESYSFCLETAAKFNARYVLLMQDDALPHANFYEVVDHLLRHRLESTVSQGQPVDGAHDWGWLKLNFPNEFANYHRSPFFVFDWVALSLVGASLTSIVYTIYTKQDPPAIPNPPQKKTYRNRHSWTTYYIFVVSFGYFFLAVWLIGRQYFLRLYGLSKYFARLDPGTTCCIPAVLFPQERVAGLVEYLNDVFCKPGFPLDFALEVYRERENLRQYLAVPNLFSHIGFYSALRGGTNRGLAYAFLDEFTFL